MVRISEIDIIKELEKDASQTYTQIAKKFGVTEAAIRKRIKNLIEKGIIERYNVEINYKRLGFEIFAIIGIDCKPECMMKLAEELKKEENIRKIFTTSGDHSILIEAVFKTSEEFSRFLKKLEKKKGTLRVCPSIIVSRIK